MVLNSVTANTAVQHLVVTEAPVRVQLGHELTY